LIFFFEDAAANKKNAESIAQLLVVVKTIYKQLLGLTAKVNSHALDTPPKFPLPLPAETLVDGDKIEQLAKADLEMHNMLVS
jgi:hypothetical protein